MYTAKATHVQSILREMSKKLTALRGEVKWYDMSVKIEEIVTGQKNLPPNVDFYSASVYHSLGIDHDLFTPIFAVSRVSGWTAHILGAILQTIA